MTSSSAGSPIDVAEDATPHKHGIGVLEVLKEQKPVALPLARMDITAKVGGCFADVRITQVFRNDHSDPLEAVYTFPMPGAAAVSSFEMRAAGRTIFGVVAEREEARGRYDEALDQGRSAGLLEQERDDVFTLQVGNIPPNEDVTITLGYSEPLTLFESGSTELRLPLVLGLRYVPGRPLDRMPTGDGIEPDTDIVPDASRISPPRLVPGFDPQTDLRIQVELVGDTAVADLTCSQHAVRLQTVPGVTTITLARECELLNRDFVLRWKATGESVTSALLYHRTPDGALFGALSMIAPAGDPRVASLPRDVVFLLDRSGSMMGPKIASAARACAKLIATLGPSDRFALLSFSDEWTWLHGTSGRDRFIAADQAGIARGQQLLRSVEAVGGTELDAALGEGLAAFDHVDRAGRTAVVVLITDGEVMDESRILSRVQKTRGNARIFTVGIDTAVNSALLSRLAAIGRGTSAFVEPDAALDSALEAIGREIGTALVTDLRIVGDGLVDLAPETLPDLFPGRAATIFFRSSATGGVTVLGRYANGSPFSSTVQARTVDLPAIAHLWARGRVRDLEDRFRMRGDDREAVRQEIVSVSLAHSVLTRFTAFIAIDDRAAVEDPRQRRKIVQPVHVPDQWAMPLAPPMPRMPGMAAPDASAMSTMADIDVRPRASRTLSMPTGSPVQRARHELEEAVSNLRRLLEKFAKSAETALLEQFLQRIERLIEILDRQDAEGSKPRLVHALEDLRVALRELLDRRVQLEAAARRSLQQLMPHEESWWKRFWEKTV